MSEHEQYSDQHAGARLSTHEAVCTQRYEHLTSIIGSMSARIGKLEGQTWIIAGTLIVGMGGLIVTLALRSAH